MIEVDDNKMLEQEPIIIRCTIVRALAMQGHQVTTLNTILGREVLVLLNHHQSLGFSIVKVVIQPITQFPG